MRILHIIDSSGIYGAEIMLLCLAEQQRVFGLQPIIASIGKLDDNNKPIEVEAERRGIDIERFRMRPGPNVTGTCKIVKFAKKQNVHILHFHGYKGNILFGFIPKPILKLSRVATLHGWTNTVRFNRLWLYEALDAASLRFMDAVVLVNDRMRQHPLIRSKNGLRLHVIPNGIPETEGRALLPKTDKRIENFCRDGAVIGTIGRLSPEKGHRFLIEAFHLLEADYPCLRLLIIGEGPLRADLEKQVASTGLASRVCFTGYLDFAWRYFSVMDLFVLPSLTEGLPITLLEAMREGCPVVATRVGGIPAALDKGDAGILVTPADTVELVRGIREALNHKDQTISRCCRAKERFAKHYSSQTMAERYAEVYRSVLSKTISCTN